MYDKYSQWIQILAEAMAGKILYYQAPLDTYPSPVVVKKVFKNGKIRLSGPPGVDNFTVDVSHTDRFRRKVG